MWSNGLTSNSIEDLTAGEYSVTVTDTDGCVVVDNIEITAPDSLELTITSEDIKCFGENNGEIIITGFGGTTPYTYSLNGNLFNDRNSYTDLAEGSYLLEIRDANGCIVSATNSIVEPLPLAVNLGEDVFIERGDQVTIEPITNTPINVLSIKWISQDSLTCLDCIVQNISPLATTAYSIEVTNENGCVAQDFINLFVDQTILIYPPNIFSPNGDGVNDFFTLFAKEGHVKSIESCLLYTSPSPRDRG